MSKIVGHSLGEPLIEFDHSTATEIQGRVAKYGERNAASRFLQVKRDRGRIVGWRQNLQMILQVFNVRPDRPHPAISNHPFSRQSCWSTITRYFWTFAMTCGRVRKIPVPDLRQ